VLWAVRSDVNKTTVYKAKVKALGGKAETKIAGCKANANDLSFKAKAKPKILALRPRPWPTPNITGWFGNL